MKNQEPEKTIQDINTDEMVVWIHSNDKSPFAVFLSIELKELEEDVDLDFIVGKLLLSQRMFSN